MLVTQQPLLKHFWYPVIPLERLGDEPVALRLLGVDIAVWLGEDGQPAAVRDQCVHRRARLSGGWISGCQIVCPYHGWTYGTDGICTYIPQTPTTPPGRAQVAAYHCQARYGYVWVALAEPLTALPQMPEHDDPSMRIIPEFYEQWQCAGLRLMENSFDNAHFSFVHRNTFGPADPVPADLEITETDYGFRMTTSAKVKNTDEQKELLGMDDDETVRHMTNDWFLPFGRKLHIRYPNDVEHAIVTFATPVDDESSLICQWVYRSDSEADAPAEGVVGFDRKVTLEDRAVLETTDPDVPLDTRAGGEKHMPSDKPGMVMRQQLQALLERYGEPEARRDGADTAHAGTAGRRAVS